MQEHAEGGWSAAGICAMSGFIQQLTTTVYGTDWTGSCFYKVYRKLVLQDYCGVLIIKRIFVSKKCLTAVLYVWNFETEADKQITSL